MSLFLWLAKAPFGADISPHKSQQGNRAATHQALQQPLQQQQESRRELQLNNPQGGEPEDDDDQVDEPQIAPNALQQAPKKLRWTGPMEVMLLELYIRESKLNQSFKRNYDLFLALKKASGFGWDNILCTSNCAQIWGFPYPKFQNLDEIFGILLATGEASHLLSQQLLVNSQPADPNVSGESGQNNATNSPTAYLSRSHSAAKKELAAGTINGLVTYLQSLCKEFTNRLQARQSLSAAPPPTQSNTCRALEMYQEVHAGDQGSQNEALDAFEIFRDDLKTKIFISIKDAHLQTQWLHKQID
ncbi:hypothetical protein PCANC_27179 [Puccinia coronata f. sp. avenae]|uniref:Myb/SANT-like domain-containing protein n=1 Tax=Puccinia coronata f. sp. avenae TaxID=200324 RepID=A0A2N5TK85_9BASI|nr:hypothetical protein PCANC_27179 [Puccinia coronata f. sp. avenae]